MAIYNYFKRVSSDYSDHIAISAQTTRLTYHEIKMIALKCEYALNCYHKIDTSPIIVSLKNKDDARLFALFLGIMKSSRAYFYIDHSTPLPIIQTMIANVNPSLMISDDLFTSLTHKHLDLKTILSVDDQQISDNLQPESNMQSPCCLVQTSGTTNQARVVAISQRALLHNVCNHQNALAITCHDRLSLLTTPQFSAANSAIYAALLSGARLCPYSVHANGLVDFIDWIDREKITILHLTPSLFRLLADYISKNALPSIRAIKLGGELVYAADVALFKEKFGPHCVLINGLGMSEAAGNIAHYFIHHDTVLPPETSIVPIGHVLDGHEVMIVDTEGKLLPTGETGEIMIRSEFLANGYWHDDEATALKFYPVEDSQQVDLYTNDIGYFLPNGLLMHLGRKDRLIKRHGFRVDLNLIESTLANFNEIKRVAVYYTTLANMRDSLIACIQLADGISTDSTSIRQQLEMSLPTYMMPQIISIFPEFPLTQSGKIDHQKILCDLKNNYCNKTRIKPRNMLEHKICLLWQKILQNNDINVYDNFFELGGDSLRAMEFIARIEHDLNLTLSIETLLSNQTIAQLAENINYATRDHAQHNNKLKTLKVSMLKMRDTMDSKRMAPLVFIPGAVMSEKELLLITGLFPHLYQKQMIYGIRLNLLEKELHLPSTVEEIAHAIADCISINLANTIPILIGECISCTLTVEVARQLLQQSGIMPHLVLLNPWHPQLPTDKNKDKKPMHIVNYFKLLQSWHPLSYPGLIDIIFAKNQTRTSTEFLNWWLDKTKTTCNLHKVSGDLRSYIRIHVKEVAQVINDICKSHQTIESSLC